MLSQDLETQLQQIKEAQAELERVRESVSQEVVTRLHRLNVEAEDLLKRAHQIMRDAQRIADIAGIPYDLPEVYYETNRIGWEYS